MLIFLKCKIIFQIYRPKCLFFVLFRMLRNNKISCVHNDSFTGLHNVRLLSLYDNQLTTITPGAFDTLQTLSTLWDPGIHTRLHSIVQLKFQCSNDLSYTHSLPVTSWPTPSTVTVGWPGSVIGWGVGRLWQVTLAASVPASWRRSHCRMLLCPTSAVRRVCGTKTHICLIVMIWVSFSCCMSLSRPYLKFCRSFSTLNEVICLFEGR